MSFSFDIVFVYIIIFVSFLSDASLENVSYVEGRGKKEFGFVLE